MICRRTVLCVISVLSFSIVTTVSFAGSQLGTNVALNKTVNPMAGKAVVNGDIFFGWFANESLDPPACTDCIRFTVDLGSTHSIRRIAVNVVNTPIASRSAAPSMVTISSNGRLKIGPCPITVRPWSIL